MSPPPQHDIEPVGDLSKRDIGEGLLDAQDPLGRRQFELRAEHTSPVCRPGVLALQS